MQNKITNFTKENKTYNVLVKFYSALIDAIKLQAKIEKIIKRFNFLAIYDELVASELKKLSLKLNRLVCEINFFKKELEKFSNE